MQTSMGGIGPSLPCVAEGSRTDGAGCSSLGFQHTFTDLVCNYRMSEPLSCQLGAWPSESKGWAIVLRLAVLRQCAHLFRAATRSCVRACVHVYVCLRACVHHKPHGGVD